MRTQRIMSARALLTWYCRAVRANKDAEIAIVATKAEQHSAPTRRLPRPAKAEPDEMPPAPTGRETEEERRKRLSRERSKRYYQRKKQRSVKP